MQTELTLSELYEGIADQLATARTKALMGERREALGILRAATLEYTRFRDVLSAYPGFHAMEHAFSSTLQALCEDDEREAAREHQASEQKDRSKRRTRKAA